MIRADLLSTVSHSEKYPNELTKTFSEKMLAVNRLSIKLIMVGF